MKIIIEVLSESANSNTKEYLYKLYIIKYFCQIMLFFKELINYTINAQDINRGQKNLLTKEEMKNCKKYSFDENKILTLCLFKELAYCNSEYIKNKPDLIKDNEKELDDIIKLYLQILKKINNLEDNLKKNNKINN